VADHETTLVPASRIKQNIAKLLKQEDSSPALN
jgi:hypothetical protein